MPVEVIGCNDSAPSTVSHSRWHERSHYAGQVAAAILAFLTFVPSNQSPLSYASITGRVPASGSAHNAVMYPSDKQTYMQDEPAVLRDVPSVKPEPASLPSVPAVSVPTRVVDKPTPLPLFGPLPSRKYPPRSLDNQHLGR